MSGVNVANVLKSEHTKPHPGAHITKDCCSEEPFKGASLPNDVSF